MADLRVEKSDRGFTFILCEPYLARDLEHQRVASESSAIGDYDDAIENPGSSFLWIGDYHHLNREQVAQLVGHLQGWLETGELERSA